MFTLREKELSKLSIILGIPEESMLLLKSMNLLNDSMAIDLLMAYEFKKIRSSNKYKSKEIIAALAKEYKVTIRKATHAVYHKKEISYHCKLCGKPMSKYKFRAHDGICEACVVDSIKI